MQRGGGVPAGVRVSVNSACVRLHMKNTGTAQRQMPHLHVGFPRRLHATFQQRLPVNEAEEWVLLDLRRVPSEERNNQPRNCQAGCPNMLSTMRYARDLPQLRG